MSRLQSYRNGAATFEPPEEDCRRDDPDEPLPEVIAERMTAARVAVKALILEIKVARLADSLRQYEENYALFFGESALDDLREEWIKLLIEREKDRRCAA